MILSFKQELEYMKGKILSGIKIHSIRLDPGNRWKPGRKIHFATGVRTPNYHCFKEGVCKSVQEISFDYDPVYLDPIVFIDNIKIDTFRRSLNINDGFKTLYAFYKFFNKNFKGKIIHWTDFRY